MFLVYDLETSGLPQFPSFGRYYDPRDLTKYDSARIVSISWILLDNQLQIVDKQTHLIKPDNFIIPQSSINIHKITNERAHAEGKPLRNVLDILASLPSIHTVIAHNVWFDVNVLTSECYRYQYLELINMLYRAYKYCTMYKAKILLGLSKNPKLTDLYKYIYDEEMENAHDAEFDTLACYRCYEYLAYIPQRNPNDRPIRPRNKRLSETKYPVRKTSRQEPEEPLLSQE